MPILFRPEFVPKILDGTKTQTRRLWKKPHVKEGGVYQARTRLFGKPFALIKVKRLRRQRIWDMTEEEAHAEGFKDWSDFLEAFLEINKMHNSSKRGGALVMQLPDVTQIEAWVIEFELIGTPTEGSR